MSLAFEELLGYYIIPILQVLVLKKLILSSNANNGSNASLGNFNSNNSVGNSNHNIGFQTYCV